MKGAIELLVAGALAAGLAGGALFHVQARSGYVPPDHALDLARPETFLAAGSAAVGPSTLGWLRWEADAPLRLRLPGLGPPSRLLLNLFPECSGAVLDISADGRAIGRLALEPDWTVYEVEPAVASEVLGLARVDGPSPCPVHISAVRTSAVVRRSSGFPRFWIVRARGGGHPPPIPGSPPWLAAGALLGTAAAAAAWRRRNGLATWLRLVAPGVVLLALAEVASRTADLRLAYPPASFPALVLLPGLLLLAWRRRRELAAAFRRRVLPVVAPTTRAGASRVGARPVLAVTCAALLVWGWIVGQAVGACFDGDLRELPRFGTRFGGAEVFSGVRALSKYGYDGQFYAVLATDPFLLEPETLERMDSAAHRATRILVPLLAWALGLGRPDAVLWTYLGLCWLLTLWTVPLTAWWLREQGDSPWWAALLVANAGLLANLLQVTLDAAALCFLLAALAAHRKSRIGWAAAAATAAALTKETFVLGALCLAAVEVLRRRWARAAALALPPAAALGLWRLRVAAATEETAQPLAVIFELPLRWLPEKLVELAELPTTMSKYLQAEILGLAVVALTLAAAVRLLPRAPRDPAILTLAAFSALALTLSYAVYIEIFTYARVLVALPVLALAISGNPDLPNPTRWYLRATAALSAAAGLAALTTRI